jgi:hypothetical protein
MYLDQLKLSPHQKEHLRLFVRLVHWAFMFFLTVPVFITHSPTLLLFVIWANAIVLTGWYLFGTCILIPIENHLNPDHHHPIYDNGREVSEIAMLLVKALSINPKTMYYVISCFPLATTTLGLLKLHTLLMTGRRS